MTAQPDNQECPSATNLIHAGSKLQSKLFDVLIRSLRNAIGIVCGINEMYLQIEIEEEVRPFFRNRWATMKRTMNQMNSPVFG